MSENRTQPQADTINVSLEAARLESIAETYPESIRADFIWLGNHVRDHCNRNLDVLVHKCRKLGFSTNKTTFSKVLRGRLQLDGDGNPTPSPCISLRNFSQIVDALRSEAKSVWIAGRPPFVETETWFDIEAMIKDKAAPDTICKFGLILGPTGSQKTTCAKHFQFLNNSGRCVHIEAPEKPTMGRFIRELAAAYGIAEKVNGEKLRVRITGNVNERKIIIVDNVQRLYKPQHGWNQEIFSFLQKLQDDTNCTIILCSIPQFADTLKDPFFEQIIGRCGGWNEVLVLDDYATREDILAIAEAFKLQNAESHVEYLEKLTRLPGRIRILFNVLQKGKRLADANGQKLSIKHLRVAAGEEEAQ